MQSISNVKIGNMRSQKFADLTGPICRPQAQLDAILAFHKEHPCAWWAGNPFEPEPNGHVFKCTFSHAYFSVDGRYCTVSVTPTGRIKSFWEGTHSFQEDVDAVVKHYGAFHGA